MQRLISKLCYSAPPGGHACTQRHDVTKAKNKCKGEPCKDWKHSGISCCHDYIYWALMKNNVGYSKEMVAFRKWDKDKHEGEYYK